jgi:bifunctional non-homologous end joining protein LigD
MGLKEYWKKRDFTKTAEPQGKTETSSGRQLHFVVQKHAASHLHYDFRLEVDGVLKSWAVPKGPSLNPTDKRLAVQVEDHPYEYRTFEGTIPEGSYGAGTVIVWDEGTYTATNATTAKESEMLMRQGLENGRISFILQGHKLQGEFSLIQLKGKNRNQWLLIKKNDTHASPVDITEQDNSVRSSRTLKESKKAKNPKKPEAAAKQSIEAAPIKPMLATLVEEPFDHPDWIFEIKWDGYRALAEMNDGKVNLYSRNLHSFNQRFEPIVRSLASLKLNALLDGEIVLFDQKDRPSFQLLQNYQRNKTGTLIYCVFDLLYLNGKDLRHLPLIERKEILRTILPDDQAHIRYCDHIVAKGKSLFKRIAKSDFEGMMAKEAQSSYQTGRSRAWLKVKTHKRQEAVVCGFTEPKGERQNFGSLILGVYNHDTLEYIGNTGSGFDNQNLAAIHKQLLSIVQTNSPFETPPKISATVTWVKPQLVCEINFAEWTDEGQMRQPIFVDFREDKAPKEVTREKTVPVEQILENKKVTSHKNSKKSHQPLLTHLEKIYWPQEGYTKGDLIEYYRQVAPYILPYLIDRPQTLHRYPRGIAAPGFFQKDIEDVPDWIRTERVKHEARDVNYILIDDEASLLYVANLGCIELNPFNSRIQSLDHPDYMVIDLDPENISFDKVIETAQVVHAVLDEIGAPSVCKTSGATGLHIYVPMRSQYPYEMVSQFAHSIVQVVHARLPAITSLERSPQKRKERVYLDYLQNNFGQTLAAPYCVRPKPGAPVSTPLKWSEVKQGLDPAIFTIKTVIKRFNKIGDLFKPILGPGIDLLKCQKKLRK